ncbi:hypothetical protein ACWKSU_17050 (plasmid) [Enterobacter cloacae]|nr:hypothetical protein [Escherichia coli]
MQIEKVMSLLEVLSSWLEDNINMDSEIIFDNDEDNTNSEILYPAVEKANAVCAKWHLYLQILFMQFDSACSLP